MSSNEEDNTPNKEDRTSRPAGQHDGQDHARVRSWKSFTAKEINKSIGSSGTVWQEVYWDRMIRHEAHFDACAGYLRSNPEKAKLSKDTYILFERSPDAPSGE